MTISVTTLNVSKADQRGPDRSILPDLSGLITVVSGDSESDPINIKGLHAIGLVLPAAITSVVTVELHVSNLEDGTYAKLADSGEFTLGALQAVSSTSILAWNWLKVVYVAAATGGGSIPLSFS